MDRGNIFEISMVFCLVLLGYLDPYQSSIEQQEIKSYSHHIATSIIDMAANMKRSSSVIR